MTESPVTESSLIPEKEVLERMLGETYSLNGSFASLWAIETLLRAVRKRPDWARFCGWMPGYIASLLERAFTEMSGLQDARHRVSGLRERIASDFKLLLQPPVPFPVFAGDPWQPAPVLHLAAAPWYGLSALAKEKLFDSFEEGPLQWLVDEGLRFEVADLGLPETLARKILKALLWPTLTEKGNARGEKNLQQLKGIYLAEETLDDFVKIILRLVVSQDRVISVLAAATCFLINIAPTSPLEARCFKRCLEYFGTPPQAISGETPERILEIIKILTSNLEVALSGSHEPDYLEHIKFMNQEKYREAGEAIERLLVIHPQNSLYLRTRGRLNEKMAKSRCALDDYDLSLSLKPDYWQAWVNRAAYHAKQKNYGKAESDYMMALKLRPDCETTRDNLLSVYFLKRSSGES